MLEHFNLLQRFEISSKTAMHFVRDVAVNMNDNRYHNWQHAFSVAHYSFLMLYKTRASEFLRRVDILAILVAAVCHDLNHPGTNNDFEIKSRSLHAVTYSDISVLEAFHASRCFQIMWTHDGDGRHPGEDANIFANIPLELQTDARKMVIDCILATDMSHHFSMVEKMKDLGRAPDFDQEDKGDRAFIGKMLVHAADISNPVIPDFEVVKDWAERITDEFISIYKKEVEHNLPCTEMFRKAAENADALPGSQVGFITYVVGPMWIALADIFVELEEVEGVITCMNQNKERWQALIPTVKEVPAKSGNSEGSDVKNSDLEVLVEADEEDNQNEKGE